MPAALSSSTPAGASSVASLQQRATALASQIQADYDKLDILDEGFNQAEQRVSHLRTEIAAANASIEKQSKLLAADRARLRRVAITAYVDGGSNSGLAALLSSNAGKLPMQQAYLDAASGDLGQAEATVTSAEHEMSVHRSSLQGTERRAAAAEHRIAAERAAAEQITTQLEGDLAQVKGRLATAVAAAERRKQLQEQAAARAAALAQQQQITTTPPAPAPAPPSNPAPVSGGGSGAVAVRAAESQLGVPYVWGGATPGVGFDCSGLTMWSWAQAGVSLDHGATDQYYEITHVSMSDLQPGDLIFYGDASYLYHVVMYVGSGPYGSDTVIQAQQTGTNVMFTPIPPGAYGAGQP